MAQIEGLGYMLEVLRRRISSNTQRAEATSSTKSQDSSSATSRMPTRTNVAALREKVRDRLRSLNPDEPQHRNKAVRIFLESVILWEFGEDIAPSAELAEIVTSISSEMDAHPTLRNNLHSLVDELIKQ